MGKLSENRIKFSRSSLSAIEKKVNKGAFTKESYLYDSNSHLAVRVRPHQSYTESVFCLYGRIRVRSECTSKLYKRQIMKVGEARNSGISLSELRLRADSMFLEIQEGRDPQVLARQEIAKQINSDRRVKPATQFLSTSGSNLCEYRPGQAAKALHQKPQ